MEEKNSTYSLEERLANAVRKAKKEVYLQEYGNLISEMTDRLECLIAKEDEKGIRKLFNGVRNYGGELETTVIEAGEEPTETEINKGSSKEVTEQDYLEYRKEMTHQEFKELMGKDYDSKTMASWGRKYGRLNGKSEDKKDRTPKGNSEKVPEDIRDKITKGEYDGWKMYGDVSRGRTNLEDVRAFYSECGKGRSFGGVKRGFNNMGGSIQDKQEEQIIEGTIPEEYAQKIYDGTFTKEDWICATRVKKVDPRAIRKEFQVARRQNELPIIVTSAQEYIQQNLEGVIDCRGIEYKVDNKGHVYLNGNNS